MAKSRLDELLLAKGLFEDIEEARRAIWAGEVIVNDHLADQPAAKIAPDVLIRIRTRRGRFVSRGGEKLEDALTRLNIRVEGRVALDVGASTGGFTDCLLARGAKRVYAIDVGRGQLAQKLKLDPRVVDYGGRDVMTLDIEDFDAAADLAVMDVTFRSLAEILPHVHSVMTGEREIVALLKPLFEARLAGMGRVGEVQRRVFEYLLPRLRGAGLPIHDIVASELPGGGGAVEFFFHVKEPGLSDAHARARTAAALEEAKGLMTRRKRGAS